MKTTTGTRVFSGSSGARVNFASASDIDDLGLATFHGYAIVYRTSDGPNQFVLFKGTTFPNFWSFLLDDPTGSNSGCLRFLVGRATLYADYFASANAVALNTLSVIGFSWDPAVGCKLFVGGMTGAVVEVSSYGTSQLGSGTPVTDASYDLLVGNDASLTRNFLGEIERVGLGTGTCTAADVQAWRDHALARGDLLTSYLGNNTTDADESNHSRTGTPTSTTTGTARDPLWIPEPADFWDTETPTRYNQYAANEYIYTSEFARLRFTTAATSVDITAYNTLEVVTRPSMTAIGVVKDNAYAGQFKPTVQNAYNRGTVSISAGSIVEVVNGARSRRVTAATPPQEGSFAVTLRFNAAATVIAPTTPASTFLVVGDSVNADAYTTDPVHQKGHWLQYRYVQQAASGHRVAFFGYGGMSWYYGGIQDSTYRAAFVAKLAEFSPRIIWFALGANDQLNALWSTASCIAALPTFIALIKSTLTPVPLIYIQTPVRTNIEANNPGQGTMPTWRSALESIAPIDGVVFVDGLAALSSGNIQADNVHATNAGADEMFAYFPTKISPFHLTPALASPPPNILLLR